MTEDGKKWISAGQAAERNCDFVAAETYYRRALEMMNDLGALTKSSALMHLGKCLVVQERYEEAESVYQNALRLQETHGGELMRIAATLSKLAFVCSAQNKAASADHFRSKATMIVAKELRALDGEYWNHGEFWSP